MRIWFWLTAWMESASQVMLFQCFVFFFMRMSIDYSYLRDSWFNRNYLVIMEAESFDLFLTCIYSFSYLLMQLFIELFNKYFFKISLDYSITYLLVFDISVYQVCSKLCRWGWARERPFPILMKETENRYEYKYINYTWKEIL